MVAQDFCHCSQANGESVSDFIRWLERTFQLAYGHDRMMPETRDALLHGAMQYINAYLYDHDVTVITHHSAVNGKHGRWWLKEFGSGVKKINIIH